MDTGKVMRLGAGPGDLNLFEYRACGIVLTERKIDI
ncbi:MAG: hypothetical protein JWQ10_913 [Herbaspirillum sp.]|nr:hypothetical protein [Herbaspirillum sp.]